ncbi:MerR family transcriptional regulator [Nocardioides mangrovicus]|nr:DICT sensory domain-containing protein [Nocardioides mangrovicus]
MATPASPGGLSIGDLEARTGVGAATVRSWEQRFGFPVPARSVGGQRRYTEGHVEQVRRLLAERERGLGLAAAIEVVTRQAGGDRTLFAELRAAHPQLDVMTVGLRVMRDLAWAIEDECLARASRPVLWGCFQNVASYERSGRRWRELARRARRAVVLADFEETSSRPSPERVALPGDSPLLEEWGVVCEAEEISVVLIGWERPRRDGSDRRTFEALVSVDPPVVRDAAARYARAAEAGGLRGAEPSAPTPLVSAAGSLSSMSLLRRFAVYTDR